MAYRANISRPKTGSTQLYDWGDGHGKVHSRPKKTTSNPKGTTAKTSSPMYGNGAMAAAGAPGKVLPKPAAAVPKAKPMDPRITAWQNGQLRGLGTARDNALLDFTQQAGQAASAYGFNTKTDASGNPMWDGSLTVNPQDPFSKMALLQQSYEGQTRGTTNNYAAQGQLYSGAIQNQRASDLSANNQNKDALAKAFQDVLYQIRQGRKGAIDTYNTGVGGVGAQALQMALGG